jgi:hypothetical protein
VIEGDVGERRDDYKPQRYSVPTKQKGRTPRPFFPFLKCPHTRKEKISNCDNEIAAGRGRKPYWAGRVEMLPGGVSPPQTPIHPANKTLAPQRRQGLFFWIGSESKARFGRVALQIWERLAG